MISTLSLIWKTSKPNVKNLKLNWLKNHQSLNPTPLVLRWWQKSHRHHKRASRKMQNHFILLSNSACQWFPAASFDRTHHRRQPSLQQSVWCCTAQSVCMHGKSPTTSTPARLHNFHTTLELFAVLCVRITGMKICTSGCTVENVCIFLWKFKIWKFNQNIC